MSTPKRIHQEGVSVNIADLDGAITSKNGTSKSESSANVCHKVVQGAVEHEDILYSTNKQPISQVTKEVEKCGEKPVEETNDHFEYHLVGLPDRTPNCLGSSGSCHSCNNGLIGNQGASLDKVEPRRSNSSTTLTRKRRRMTTSSEKTAKRRKTSKFCLKAKVLGRGHQTNQTCMSGNGTNGAISAPTKTDLTGAAFWNQGCQGGGGVDDGGDDGSGQNKKVIVHDSLLKAVIPKNKKSSSDEMEVDPSLSDSSMDVDSSSSEKESNDCHVDHNSLQATRPEEKPPRHEDQVVCGPLYLHVDKSKCGSTCCNCNLQTKIPSCSMSEQTHNVSAVQNQPPPQNVGRAVLSITTTITSMGTDEAVAHCDDNLKGEGEKESNDCHVDDNSLQATRPEEKPRHEDQVVCGPLYLHVGKSKCGCTCCNCNLQTKIPSCSMEIVKKSSKGKSSKGKSSKGKFSK